MTNVLDNSHTCGNLRRARNQRLLAGGVLIPQMLLNQARRPTQPAGLAFKLNRRKFVPSGPPRRPPPGTSTTERGPDHTDRTGGPHGSQHPPLELCPGCGRCLLLAPHCAAKLMTECCVNSCPVRQWRSKRPGILQLTPSFKCAAAMRSIRISTRLLNDPQCYWQPPRRQPPSRGVLA
jgi:hypothetical protein